MVLVNSEYARLGACAADRQRFRPRYELRRVLGLKVLERAYSLKAATTKVMMSPGTELLAPAVKLLLEFAKERIAKKLDQHRPFWDDALTRIEAHLTEAVRWSSRIQFFGMAEGQDTGEATVDLKLVPGARKVRVGFSAVDLMTEEQLLNDRENYLVLGDPGAGKTTVLKRLVHRIVLTEPVSDADIYRFPVVVRLREFSPRSFALVQSARQYHTPR